MRIMCEDYRGTRRGLIMTILIFISPFLALISGFKPANPIIIGDNVERELLIISIFILLMIFSLYSYLFLTVRRGVEVIQMRTLAKPIIYLLHFYLMIALISLSITLGFFVILIRGSSAFSINIVFITFSPSAYFIALGFIFSAIGAYMFFGFSVYIFKPKDSDRLLNIYVFAVLLDISIILSGNNAFGNIIEPNFMTLLPKIFTALLYVPPITIVTIRSIRAVIQSKKSIIKIRNKVLIMGNLFLLVAIVHAIILKLLRMPVFSTEYILAHSLLVLGVLILYKAFS